MSSFFYLATVLDAFSRMILNGLGCLPAPA